jgi:DHA2 family metal-tetracycline-proton antiporter-like MFS transporter
MYSGGSLLGLLSQFYFAGIIAARFIQGAGASVVPALIMVIVARYIGSEDRGKAFGLVGSFVAMGEGIGPAIGGVVAHYIHWSVLFMFPMMTLLSIPFFVHALPNEDRRKGKVDFLGALLLSLGIVMVTLYTTQFQMKYILFGFVLFVGFAIHILHTEQPFIEPSLFMNRKFILGFLTGCILLGTAAGFISMVPYMMKDVHHMTTDIIGGVIIFPGSMSVILFGIVGGTLVDKRGNTFVFYLGLFLIGAIYQFFKIQSQS